MPISEVGHARNVQRFEEMVAFVSSWGGTYNPANTDLELSNLQAKLTASQAAVDGVTSSLASRKTSVNARENTFSGLRKLTTRVVNYYASTDPDANALEDAKSIKRKIDGKRAQQVEDNPLTPENETENTISVSQQSYTQLLEHLVALHDLLTLDPNYNPNETELKTDSLKTLYQSMEAANTDVITKNVHLSNQRASRNDTLYGESTGLVDLAMRVKKYVKAAYGTDSAEWNQIKGLEFSRPN